MNERPPPSDLFYCVCMILATPASILLALNADLIAGGANPRVAQVIPFIRYGSWFLSAVCPVMAVLLWRSWQKSRIKRDAPGIRCPMCGAQCATPGRCLTCGESFSEVKPAGTNPDGTSQSNPLPQPITPQPGLREYLIVLGVLTLFVVGIMFMPGAGQQRRIYCGAIVIALIWVATSIAYGIPKLISHDRSGRGRNDT
jgi:hypothetical protein